ncbi:GNAT family N-acetyltransferase [Promicromonospora sp. NPDC057488]|uniref:GNAT family N-acetyltransferase n=1 Tax=Promicromonospora sp. NPDC057488 TaxID=3346147 RepID=UPI00366D121B
MTIADEVRAARPSSSTGSGTASGTASGTVIGTGSSAPSVVVRRVRDDEHHAAAEVLVTAYSHDFEISDSYRQSLGAVSRWASEHEVWVAVPAGETGGGATRVLGVVVTPALGGPALSQLALDGELDFRLLATHPDARGGGVGETLVRHVIALARDRGARRVVMNSGDQMRAAHRLYERLGFGRLYERETRVVETKQGPTRLLAFGLDVADADTRTDIQDGRP